MTGAVVLCTNKSLSHTCLLFFCQRWATVKYFLFCQHLKSNIWYLSSSPEESPWHLLRSPQSVASCQEDCSQAWECCGHPWWWMWPGSGKAGLNCGTGEWLNVDTSCTFMKKKRTFGSCSLGGKSARKIEALTPSVSSSAKYKPLWTRFCW